MMWCGERLHILCFKQFSSHCNRSERFPIHIFNAAMTTTRTFRSTFAATMHGNTPPINNVSRSCSPHLNASMMRGRPVTQCMMSGLAACSTDGMPQFRPFLIQKWRSSFAASVCHDHLHNRSSTGSDPHLAFILLIRIRNSWQPV